MSNLAKGLDGLVITSGLKFGVAKKLENASFG